MDGGPIFSLGPVNFPHAARPDDGGHFVWAELYAGGEFQWPRLDGSLGPLPSLPIHHDAAFLCQHRFHCAPNLRVGPSQQLDVDLTPTDPSLLPGAAYVLNAALKGELGLQIIPRRTNFDVIIVDHVEYPSPN